MATIRFRKNKKRLIEKQMKKLLTIIFCFLAGIIVFTSCDEMNDIQKKYAEVEERVYLGKVDSIKVYPGLGRAKLTWYISADPKVEKTIIYWNMRNDSIIKEFTRTGPGVQKDSIIIESLPEGTSLFEFRNVNEKGESSLYSSTSVTVWGPDFGEGLYSRRVISQNFNYEESTFEIGFSHAFEGDSVAYSQVSYTTQQGEERIIRIEREDTLTTLTDFGDGQELYFQTAFFLPTGIDTIFNNQQVFKSPTAVFENGEKISLVGNLSSRYFERYGNLFEWNDTGDLIEYALDENNEYYQLEVHPSLVSRTTFRDFFFYDDDKFIGIRTNNAVSMHQIVGGQLVTVLTPAGAETFGSSYSMERFMAAKGFFFSLRNDGRIYVHPANNNATWGTPQTTQVSSSFTYNPAAVYNNKALIGIDTNGYLYSTPFTTTGTLGSRASIGSGWNKFKKLVGVDNKLLCFDESGDIYQFDFNATDFYWVIE